MYRAIAILVALGGLTACASDSNPGDSTGQNGFNVNGFAGTGVQPAAGTGAPAAPPATGATAGTGAMDPPPATGAAGTMAAVPPPAAGTGGTGGMPPVDMPGNMDPMQPGVPELELGTCEGLNTKWDGDEYCIKAPPADQGFQLHIGPSNYDNPERQYIVAAGQEITENIPATSGNTQDVYYYWRQYRMRPGSHHLILSKVGGIAGGGRMGGAQTSAKDSPTGGKIPPENQGVGMPLGARTPLSFSLHYFNFTQEPLLKEVWVNVWYRNQADVKEPAAEIFSMLLMPLANITPGRHAVITGDCSVTGEGRILTLYGHRHANNLRFSAYRERGGNRELIFEDYDWHEPTALEFSSIITNPPANPTAKIAGGYSGILDVRAGDTISFECEVINMTSRTFTGANEAMDDEMCILIGDVVGARISPTCSQTVRDVN